MSELKPCPFCGSYNIASNPLSANVNLFYCNDCGCELQHHGCDDHWNNRAPLEVKALEWMKLRELCHVSSPCDNLEYRVLEQGLDFFVTINGERFGSSNSVGLAKQMAQGHFNCLILDQIEV